MFSDYDDLKIYEEENALIVSIVRIQEFKTSGGRTTFKTLNKSLG